MMMQDSYRPDLPKKSADALDEIAPLVVNSINQQFYPGVVIYASHHGKVIYRGVFGSRSIVPEKLPMTFDTIFDAASLTKVLVTAPAVMQLVEKGKLNLDAKAADYWPEFAAAGKKDITVKMLLTHVSGLAPVIPSPELNSILPAEKRTPNAISWRGKQAALQYILDLHPDHQPNSKFVYSDINFIILSELIERVSGERLHDYAHKHIFQPLKMHNSFFLPPPSRRQEIAPTEIINSELRWGEVHDPTAWLMGGVAGMAGVFSTAADIGIFAEMILQNGRYDGGKQLLTAESVAAMTSPQNPPDVAELRGLGWDIRSPYSCGGSYVSDKSFGHTGYTGTSLWIDPVNQSWLVILTNRVHPQLSAQNQLIQDRKKIADLVGKALSLLA
ncbi:MAG TPA: serine hydrolase domain-containing protein [Gammaproteobacteria bacterium]|jgi:CubicO group peptidase (beta-lactamase class C family)|nr:serine hydrolase domain-containing protein [Gammaproteobacteria bacterium]